MTIKSLVANASKAEKWEEMVIIQELVVVNKRVSKEALKTAHGDVTTTKLHAEKLILCPALIKTRKEQQHCFYPWLWSLDHWCQNSCTVLIMNTQESNHKISTHSMIVEALICRVSVVQYCSCSKHWKTFILNTNQTNKRTTLWIGSLWRFIFEDKHLALESQGVYQYNLNYSWSNLPQIFENK